MSLTDKQLKSLCRRNSGMHFNEHSKVVNIDILKTIVKELIELRSIHTTQTEELTKKG